MLKSLFDNALADGGPRMRWLESNGADAVEAFCRQALYADRVNVRQLLIRGAHWRAFVESVLIGPTSRR